MPAAGQGVRQLGTAGLGCAGHGGLAQDAVRPGHPLHAVADGAEHALAARNRGECRGVLPAGLAGGGVHGAVRKMQGGPLAEVGQRGRVGRQLQRRHGGVALPDGGHQSQPGLVVFVAAPRQAALCLGDFNAGGRGQS